MQPDLVQETMEFELYSMYICVCLWKQLKALSKQYINRVHFRKTLLVRE